MTRTMTVAALAIAIWLLPSRSTTQAVDPVPWMTAVYILDEEVGLAQQPLEEVWGPADMHMWASIDAWYPPGADGHHVFVGWAAKCGAPRWPNVFYSGWETYEMRATADGLPGYAFVDERRDRPDVRSAFDPHCLAYWGAPTDPQPGFVARVDLRPVCPRGWTCTVQIRLLNRIGQLAFSNAVKVPIP